MQFRPSRYPRHAVVDQSVGVPPVAGCLSSPTTGWGVVNSRVAGLNPHPHPFRQIAIFMDQYIEFVTNHPYMFAALAATIGMIVFVEYERMTSGASALSPLALTRLQNDGALVIDVRDENSFKSGHLIESLNVPLGQLEKRLGEIDKRKADPVVVVCENGMRAQRACKTLKKAEFTDLHHLAGGMAAWQKANLPTASRS